MNAGPHLDDDLLSAHLDGIDAGLHLASCPTCQARLDELAAAAAAVGAPPPLPPASVVDAAVGRALDAEERRSRRPALVALAAAVLVVLGVVGAVVVGDDERPSDSDTAALRLSDDEVAGGGGTAGASATSTVAFGGDLGEMDEARELSDRVREVVEPPPTTTTAADPSGAAALEAGDTATMRAPTVRTTSDDPYCEKAVAKELDTGLGPLVYRATLRWNGTPAVAVAYRLAQPRGELDHRLYVLTSEGCRLLVAQTF
ncbi:MAG TPA: hypothetical protein VHF47_09980 [Acidimicrobiales bacterium]|nr:hypothetical protein [Acidimicrobiales bacterium]